MGKASRWKDLGNIAVEKGLCGEKLLEEREVTIVVLLGAGVWCKLVGEF